MTLSPRWRKFLLVLHVATAVSWLGADLVLLTLTGAGLAGTDPAHVYPAAALVGTVLLTPLSVLILLIGLTNGLLTRWGLFRHWWVVVKLVVTAMMTGLVLFLLAPGLRSAAELAAGTPDQDRLNMVIAPVVSSSLLVLMIVLSVYKPWGRTDAARHGERRDVRAGQPTLTGTGVRNVRR
jgi:hypothetical protein